MNQKYESKKGNVPTVEKLVRIDMDLLHQL